MAAPFYFDYVIPELGLVVRAYHDGRALMRIELRGRHSPRGSSRPGCELDRPLITALRAYFAGERRRVCVPLADVAATPFQRAVWEAIRRIPHGEVRSYGWIARAIGRPRAARAVGAACGANPWPIIVPCHRVVAADGSLGGYSAGLKWKRLLLRIEGAARPGQLA